MKTEPALGATAHTVYLRLLARPSYPRAALPRLTRLRAREVAKRHARRAA